MSIYAIDVLVAPTHSAVDKVYVLIDGAAAVTAKFVTKELYKHSKPAESGFQFVLVHEQRGYGDQYVHNHKIDFVRIFVTAACRARLTNGQENERAHEWLATIHDAIGNAIVGQKPAGLRLPIGIESTTPAVLDPDEDYWFMSYVYSVIQNPI